MKPYFLVAYNFLRFKLMRTFCCKNFRCESVELLGWNTKLGIHPDSYVQFGEHVVSDGRLVIMTGREADLKIGRNVYFNENAMISCKQQITIGEGCRFGPNVSIWDNDHKFDAVNGVSSQHRTSAVSIGRNCWIGTNAVILRGSVIGDNCVIGAGCVVKGTIPGGSVVTSSRELTIRPIV